MCRQRTPARDTSMPCLSVPGIDSWLFRWVSTASDGVDQTVLSSIEPLVELLFSSSHVKREEWFDTLHNLRYTDRQRQVRFESVACVYPALHPIDAGTPSLTQYRYHFVGLKHLYLLPPVVVEFPVPAYRHQTLFQILQLRTLVLLFVLLGIDTKRRHMKTPILEYSYLRLWTTLIDLHKILRLYWTGMYINVQ
jgi:hypothetical protein